ncbi:thermonuclease family protein [Deltaproteobacteria bacterium IMCC39524]|nr:thermonuclease family protein [Deltaproteobacteria bacterium IMCC39524]
MRLLALLLCLSCILALSACAEESGPALQGTVTWIYDGDTLEVDPHGKVRLIGIDTPERENSKRDSYLIKKGISAARQREFYQQAKAFNIKQVKGQHVTLTLDDPERDRHGRLLAYLHLPDGRMLNRVLLEQGLAVVYRRFSFRMKEDFLTAETEAMKNKQGLWK